MKKAITERQKQLLEVIYDFCASTGYPPTFEEMRENLGVSSNQSIVDLLEKLRRNGYIKKDRGARSLAILQLGYIAIGRPALAPVLVQTMKEFVSGDIVFAEVGDEGTVKRFMSDDKPPYVYLKPENPSYKNILFTDNVRIKGKVISVLKSERWQSVK